MLFYSGTSDKGPSKKKTASIERTVPILMIWSALPPCFVWGPGLLSSGLFLKLREEESYSEHSYLRIILYGY